MNQKLLDLQTHWDKSLISSYVKENPYSLSRPFAYGVPEEYKVDYSKIVTDKYGNTTITITNF